MLVLSRRENEEIVIGDDIRVSVLEIRGNRVKLGVAAGPTVRITRSEVAALPPPPQELTCTPGCEAALACP